MKKLLTICASALLFVACSSDKDLDTKKEVVITDTTGMYKSNYSTDVNTAVPDEEATKVAPTKVIHETRVVYVDRTPKTKKSVYHEANPVNPVVTQPQPQQESQNQNTASGNPTSNTGVNTGNTGGTGNGTETGPTSEPVKKEKEGWSNAAKDAVIGGVGGAVVGAVISKKKGKGAVIGGILGAAGGYILGKKKDKKDETADAKYVSY